MGEEWGGAWAVLPGGPRGASPSPRGAAERFPGHSSSPAAPGWSRSACRTPATPPGSGRTVQRPGPASTDRPCSQPEDRGREVG